MSENGQININKKIIKALKMEAIEEETTIKAIVEKVLSNYLGLSIDEEEGSGDKPNLKEW